MIRADMSKEEIISVTEKAAPKTSFFFTDPRRRGRGPQDAPGAAAPERAQAECLPVPGGGVQPPCAGLPPTPNLCPSVGGSYVTTISSFFAHN